MSEKLQPVELTNAMSLGPDDKPGTIVVVDKTPHLTVLSMCVQNDVKHVVQKSNMNSGTEIRLASLTQLSPGSFFDFPLSSIMGEAAPNLNSEARLAKISRAVASVDEKNEILGVLGTYIQTLTTSPSLLTDTLTMLDEALTNAIFSAPFFVNDKPLPFAAKQFPDTPIDPLKKPVIFAGHDAERVVIGCRDNYGSLNITNLILRIKKCYENNLIDVMNFGEGGAGIGSFLVFNSCASMYIGVDTGQSTTICCSFPLKLSATKRNEMPKNIHLIHR